MCMVIESLEEGARGPACGDTGAHQWLGVDGRFLLKPCSSLHHSPSRPPSWCQPAGALVSSKEARGTIASLCH